MPPRKAQGINTADKTKAMATTGPCTSSIATSVASTGPKPSFFIWDSTFSITTMASSTTRPIASTMANSVRVLMLNPSATKLAKVPIRDTGIASTGISVARQLCKKRNTMRITSIKASLKVLITSVTDSLIYSVLSITGINTKSSGKFCAASSNTFLTSLMVSTALASSVSLTPNPAQGAPLASATMFVDLAPVSTRATSRRNK